MGKRKETNDAKGSRKTTERRNKKPRQITLGGVSGGKFKEEDGVLKWDKRDSGTRERGEGKKTTWGRRGLK